MTLVITFLFIRRNYELSFTLHFFAKDENENRYSC